MKTDRCFVKLPSKWGDFYVDVDVVVAIASCKPGEETTLICGPELGLPIVTTATPDEVMARMIDAARRTLAQRGGDQ